MKVSIGFTGDIAFSEYTKKIYNTPEKIDKKIYDFFNKNDYNILNLESPVTKSNLSEKAALAHKSNPESLKFIKNKFKNPVISLANNHMMDFGQKGLLDTLKYIETEKLPYIGAGRNLNDATKYIILGDKIKIGVISFQYKDYYVAGKNTPGTAHIKHINTIKKQINKLKGKTDWIIVIYHGGEEFINLPMPYTRRLYRKFLKYGADIVVAHHTHTVQGYEKINNKMIFYSLGNFIFDTDFQRAQYGTDRGMLLRIEFTKENYSFEGLPIIIDRDDEEIKSSENNHLFKDITYNYKELWKCEARKLLKVKQNKKKLREYRDNFSISNLSIEKANIKHLVTFDELLKNNYSKSLDKVPKIKNDNLIERKIKRIISIFSSGNIKKYIYIKWAQIFR